MFLFELFGARSNVERVGKNQTFDNDTFISYTEYYANDYYNCTSKYWQIAYYQHCLFMTNEEAKQYVIQTMDNAQFILI